MLEIHLALFLHSQTFQCLVLIKSNEEVTDVPKAREYVEIPGESKDVEEELA